MWAANPLSLFTRVVPGRAERGESDIWRDRRHHPGSRQLRHRSSALNVPIGTEAAADESYRQIPTSALARPRNLAGVPAARRQALWRDAVGRRPRTWWSRTERRHKPGTGSPPDTVLPPAPA